MLLLNKIKIKWYLLGTIMNFGLMLKFIGVMHWPILVFFTFGIVVNHYLLAASLLGSYDEEYRKTLKIPPAILGVMKIMFIFLTFWIVLRALPENQILVVFSYIFQLLILALSIKRVEEKN